jgi:hypothetical protein
MTARRTLAVVALGAVVLAGCSGSDAKPASDVSADHESHHSTTAPPGAPLRDGERFLDLTMPKPYTPKAPTTGTDDYRCFLLDPHLADPAFVTGIDVLPGRRDLVHHVILFRVGPDEVDDAKARDADAEGQGWTCFGGAGVASEVDNPLESAPWLGAWAPGGGERVLAKDIGVPLEAGSRIIMQVHYNLLEGSHPDTSSARLRLAPASADLDPLETMLLPAPVELACRSGKPGPLCDRAAAVRDVSTRFGGQSGLMVAGLQLLCGGDPDDPKSSPVQTCERTMRAAATVRAVAGHMHLLGRSISVTLNPDTRRERVLLDIPVWDFDDQGARSLRKPAKIEPGDVLRVTCRHDQALRDDVPELEDAPERYVVWGEGTTDEMCLGIVMVTESGRK